MKFSVKIASSVIGISLMSGVLVASAGIVPGTRGSSTIVGSGNGVVATSVSASSTLTAVSIPVVVVKTASTTCPLITSFLKMGAANNAADVMKLQAFLKAHEGLDVDATGIFDAKTEAGVRAFQKTYMNDIMGPWGATRTTGEVYVTTAKKINQLACGTDTALTASEKSAVASYKGAATAAAMQNAAQDSQSSVTVTTGMPAASSADAGTEDSGPSMGARFWSFIKSFFQR